MEHSTGQVIATLEGRSGDVNSAPFFARRPPSGDGEQRQNDLSLERHHWSCGQEAVRQFRGGLECGVFGRRSTCGDCKRGHDGACVECRQRPGYRETKRPFPRTHNLHCCFSPEGRRAVTASGDGTALILRIVTLDEVPHLVASK